VTRATLGRRDNTTAFAPSARPLLLAQGPLEGCAFSSETVGMARGRAAS
jgi:hypothetical protein